MSNEAEEKLLDDEGCSGEMDESLVHVQVVTDDIAPAAVAPPAPVAPIAPALVIPTTAMSINVEEGAAPIQIVSVEANHEGRAVSMCGFANCAQQSVYSCAVCLREICNVHGRILYSVGAARSERRCVNCLSSEMQRRRTANRGMARCCVRRLIIRMMIFFILVCAMCVE